LQDIQGISQVLANFLMATAQQVFAVVQVTMNAPLIRAPLMQITCTWTRIRVNVNADEVQKEGWLNKNQCSSSYSYSTSTCNEI